MTLYDYKRQAMITARYKDSETQLTCAALGLCGEAGEVAEKVKKHYRHGTELDGEAVAKELGDILWYIASMSDCLGFSLDDIARMNIEKLSSRQERGVIAGSGDDR